MEKKEKRIVTVGDVVKSKAASKSGPSPARTPPVSGADLVAGLKATNEEVRDKLWDMQRTRILDKIQRQLDQYSGKMRVLRELQNKVQTLISWRRAGEEPFTREEAGLCEESLGVLEVDMEKGGEVLKKWDTPRKRES